MKEIKYVFVTGGVLSGLGKGIVAASIGKILQTKNSKVIISKQDGYFNFDPGTQSPTEHGECFVLDDGTEADLDFGHYERFLNPPKMEGDLSLTSGKIMRTLMEGERRGDYLGKTVQVIPHVTSLIRDHWVSLAHKYDADIFIIEIGGTVGDLENLWFLEAAREMNRNENKVIFVHLGFIPELGATQQQKTKPFQQSLSLLRDRGIFPDIVIGRCSSKLNHKTRQKINWLCNIPESCIFSDPDLNSVYELPFLFLEEGMGEALKDKLKIDSISDLSNWKKYIETFKYLKGPTVKIGICGKYFDGEDSYLSIKEAIDHSVRLWSAIQGRNIGIDIVYINTEENISYEKLKECDGIIVPGGFGSRGVEGKIEVIKYCRENNVPFLGICYGLQLAVVEFARNVCGLENANTTEVDPNTEYKVVDILPEQKDILNLGGTMRLGNYPATLVKGTKTINSYRGKDEITERHRHRYEVNPDYCRILTENGLVISGTSPDGKLVEFIENPKCDFFVATQAHPEFKSRPEYPAPLFFGFLEAIVLRLNDRKKWHY